MTPIAALLDAAIRHHRAGDLQQAERLYRQVVTNEPRQTDAWNMIGLIAHQRGQPDEAEANFRRAIELLPSFAEAHQNLGNILRDRGRLDEAVACYEESLRLRPSFVEARNNLGAALHALGRFGEARACYEEALRLRPDYGWAHVNRSHHLLVTGQFDEGWPEFEWHWKRTGSSKPPFPQPVWDGSPLHGKVILLCAEQGLGDTLQLIRYAPLVKQRGATVLLKCPSNLIPLLSRSPGIDRWVADNTELPPFDVYAPLLRLPGLFRTTLETVPADVPYVVADPELVQRWRDRLSRVPGFKIGVNWQGNPQYPWDHHRSLPLRHLAPLAKLPGVRLISLQKGFGREQLTSAGVDFEVLDLGDDFDQSCGTFMDSAAVMRTLDLVVAPDTAILHLAGAMGVPVWMATPFSPDWRWLLDRDDSPWYPTMRLFRQRRLGHWDDVFERIAAELRQKFVRPSVRA